MPIPTHLLKWSVTHIHMYICVRVCVSRVREISRGRWYVFEYTYMQSKVNVSNTHICMYLRTYLSGVSHTRIYVYVCLTCKAISRGRWYIYTCVCVCVYVCVGETTCILQFSKAGIRAKLELTHV